MESDDEFRAFSQAIKSDPIGVLLAKRRRDRFVRMLMRLPDVEAVIPSGSLARGTHIGPVHDIDLIVVFKKSAHPDYGLKGKSAEAVESAQAALTHLEENLLEQLHPWRGTGGGLLKETEQRTHVVTYRSDWAGPFKDFTPVVPPVDVLPAVREGSHLLIPERGTGWVDTDPEWLIRQVAQRQREWKYFTVVAGMVKAWAKHNHLKIKNLAIDVMVLQYCPRPGLFEALSVGDAVARFFEAAARANITSLKDPAGRCGEIDPKINFGELRSALKNAAGLAWLAMAAERALKNREPIIDPNFYWGMLFGKEFPLARKLFWRAPETEPWTVKPEAATDLGDWDPPDGPRPDGGGGPEGPDPDDRRPDGPGGGPMGPDPDPDGRNPRPHGPGGGSPPSSSRPSGPGASGPRPDADPAEPGGGVWEEVLGATPAVSLTFG